jgi:hypothetical protein
MYDQVSTRYYQYFYLENLLKYFRHYCYSYMIYTGFDNNEANCFSLGAIFIEKILQD